MNICKIFSGFKSLKIWEWDFPQLWRAITATWFSLTPHSMLMLWQMRANCLGTSTWWDSSPASLSPALDNMKVVTELMAELRILSLWVDKLRCWIENQHKTWDHVTQSHIQALTVDRSKCAFGAILHQPLFLGGFLPPLILRLPVNSSMSTQIIHCSKNHKQLLTYTVCCIAESEREGTRAETRIGLSAKRTSPFKSAGGSVQLTTGSQGVRISRQDYWLPTPFASFPFTSPPVCHRVPSHSDSALTHVQSTPNFVALCTRLT